jgi:hypothetical protein
LWQWPLLALVDVGRVSASQLPCRHRGTPPLAAAGTNSPCQQLVGWSLAGQRVGINEVDDGIWIVSFMRYDLDTSTWKLRTLQPPRQPLRPAVVTYVLGTFRYLCLRTAHLTDLRANLHTRAELNRT